MKRKLKYYGLMTVATLCCVLTWVFAAFAIITAALPIVAGVTCLVVALYAGQSADAMSSDKRWYK